jgi:2-dehydro-3-deoxyphosphogluconate aldolase/(4S)-4-hydroxy-2-oxoglutarate aldolase
MHGERQEAIQTICDRQLSAIIRTPDQDMARQAMQAAVRGGFRLCEFTLTTPGALELITEFSKNKNLMIGAGTVLTAGNANEAVAAGARFLVSPVWDPEVIAAAHKLGAAVIPGTYTPNEMLAAHRAGADFVKIFPAPADVAAFVSQVRGPLPQLRLYPTAGVTPENFKAVLAAGAAGVGFVASLFDPQDLSKGRYDAVEARARKIHEGFNDSPS